MTKYPRKSKGKEISPTFFVFCEGESEEAYIGFIRSKYRIPIRIRSKISRTKINQRYVQSTLRFQPKHEKDRHFLLYDIDRPEMLERLQSINGSVLLVSNPCIELWFILHICNQTAEATAGQIFKKLERKCNNYAKGYICEELKKKLNTETENACIKAKKLSLYNNPSTSIFRLIDEIKNVQKRNTTITKKI